jgi:hypothetical protein
MSAMVAELQEQLLVQEREVDSQENALMAREDDLVATERSRGKAHMECYTECDRAEAIWRDYWARMHTSTAGCWHSLDFDRVLRGRHFILTVRETDLEWQEEKLAEEQVQGLYSFDGRDLLMELEELHERVAEVENEHAAEAMQLSRSVMEISDALIDLGVFLIWDIPAQPRSAQDVLTVASLVLEHLREEHAFAAGPWV